MTSKFLPTAILSFVGIATLPAQNLATAFRHAGMKDSTLDNLVNQLTQNAFAALLGMVLLMGIAWVLCVWNACAEMNKNAKNASTSSLFVLLCVAVSMSMFGSSCTAAQKAQAADIQAVRAAEGRHCVCHAPLDNRHYYGNAGLNNRYPGQDYSNDTGRPFCKQCGRRVYARNR